MSSDVIVETQSKPRYTQAVRTSFWFVIVALVCLLFSDISITTQDPWTELKRMGWGIITPNFLDYRTILEALVQTIAFALVGVALGAGGGFILAQFFHIGIVRWACAFVRAIHEIFWALIFLQMLGLTPLTGLLAIGIPYAGICAKVYAETLEEADLRAEKAVPGGSGLLSTFFYARLPEVWAHIVHYTSYRFECGLRSSAVLGFIGMPTLGFHLESAFGEGNYSDAAALLIAFYILIVTLRFWMRGRLLWLYLLAAPLFLTGGSEIKLTNIVRFLTSDIVPAPLRIGDFSGFVDWIVSMFQTQVLPGVFATVILTQIALVMTAFLALVLFPLISEKFFGQFGRSIGHVFLVIVRSTPEFILAYIFLQLWGPSMLPAIVALSLHNGAIIGHLMGRYSNEILLRPDHGKGLNLYGYEIVPRIYGQFLAFLFYRWEVIMRETAILGILGIATLGFFVDSAIADIRLDRAMFLIFITAILNIGIDIISRKLRARLRINQTVEAV